MQQPDGLVVATAVFSDSQAAARDLIAANVLARVSRLWDQMMDSPRPWDDFTADVLAVVQAGQRQTAEVTAAYIRELIRQAPDATTPDLTPVKLPPSLRLPKGPPASVYERPLKQFEGDVTKRRRSPAVARERAHKRLMVMVDSDLTAAMREGARQAADHPDVVAMRRIIRPELSRGGSCGLCVAAADRIYSKRVLMPVHGRCKCEQAIVTRGYDPGLVLNEDDFALLYGPTKYGPHTDTSPASLKRVRVVVSEHGEFGPVLRRAEDHFRGPAEVAAA